ncbi:hypothetical protein C9374_011863 [Naegleria lovaniensis]|uniref:DUF4116 domain-containing protein n=1 Tax=Naegleria lovaniensis TaxID=51637 RepID=A0AA88KEK7_NAELO|nr:uncharacterized protein C9374_011863 [Naegleria lovaniensis]KAG2373774.1 hypothetical protein C9374_011863 [Naegleria lovaniensis]
MKRKLSGHSMNDDHHVAIYLPTNKHLKLSNTTTDQVQLVLLDFHHVSSSLLMNQHSQIYNPHLNHLYDLLKRKFENQSKGFAKWLLAREEWLAKSKTDKKINIEFINDHECVLKWARCFNSNHYEKKLFAIAQVQFIDIAKLYKANQEQVHSVEFWKPFQEEIWYQLQLSQLDMLNYLPVEVFTQFKDWKEKLANIYRNRYGLDFVFDLDDIEKAKKAISEKRCEMFQISERLKDNEEFMKHAIQCHYENIRFASERLKNDRKFCLDVFISTPDSWSCLFWAHTQEFALEILRITLPTITIVDGNIQDIQIQACIPKAYVYLSQSVWISKLSMDDKMKIFQQFFLNDSNIDDYKNTIQSRLQMLLELPDEYYQAHHNHQHTLQYQGKFAFSLSKKDLDNDSTIIEQVLTRIYKNYDPPWKYDESSFGKREDLPLILKYGPMHLRKDRQFVLNALKCVFSEISSKDIFPEHRNDREIVLAFMRRNGHALYEKEECGSFIIPEEFRNDTEIILAALKSEYPCWFNDIPQHCRESKELLLRILHDPLDDEIQIDIRNVLQGFVARKDQEVIAALKKDSTYWYDLSVDFRNDRDFLLDAIRNQVPPSMVFHFASTELKQDTTFIMDCVKAHKKGLNSILYYTEAENYDRNLYSEIAIEHVKSWGDLWDEIFNACFNQDPTDISLDEVMKFCKDLKNLRLEHEYFGCHIPESWLMKEKIVRFEGLQNKSYWKNAEKGYNFWKQYLGAYVFNIS